MANLVSNYKNFEGESAPDKMTILDGTSTTGAVAGRFLCHRKIRPMTQKRSAGSHLSTIHLIIQSDIYQAVHFSSSTAAWTDPRGSGADIPDGEIPPKVLRALLCSISGCP